MSAKPQFTVRAMHRNGPPTCRPNPAYPNGIDVRETAPGVQSCRAELPYPAPERLIWSVRCRLCGRTLMLTAAGRADDPRSVTIPCRDKLQ